MEIEKLVRPNIAKLKPYTSARSQYLEGVLLDANENPFGSTVTFYNEELNRYPDPNQTELRNKLAEFLNINSKNLFFGVGSDEIIDLLIRVFCKPGFDSAIVCEPTYGMYRVACEINDIEVKELSLDSNFDIDESIICNEINEKTKILFLCSPNNPTGNLLSKEKIISIASKNNIIVVVDEAYIDFADKKGLIEEIKKYNNIVLLRTFSKAWGMAGVRCGYCVADEYIINTLMKVKAPYSINKLTARMILQALNNVNIYNSFIGKIISEREKLITELKTINKIFNVVSTDSNFILFKVDEAKLVFKKLVAKNIVIRDRTNQKNLDGYLRVSIGTEEENKLFITELRNILCS